MVKIDLPRLSLSWDDPHHLLSTSTKLLDNSRCRVRPHELVTDGRRLYFVAGNDEFGEEIWVSDGTGVGTRRLTDLWPGAGSSLPSGLAIMDEGPWLYFVAWTESTWAEPFRLALPFFDDGFESGDTSAWSVVVP